MYSWKEEEKKKKKKNNLLETVSWMTVPYSSAMICWTVWKWSESEANLFEDPLYVD